VLSIVRRNFQLKAFAFALAVVAWAYFHFSASPGITAHFDQQLSVPIVVSGLRPGFVAQFPDKFAVVTIDVTHNEAPVKADHIVAMLNLPPNAGSGIITLPVQVVAPDVQVRSVTPASIALSIDRLEERFVPVSIAYNGDAKNVVVESISVNPSLVSVRGIAADLARVQSVRVDIPVPAKAATVDAMFRPAAVGAHDDEIAAVAVSPNLVRLRARFVHSIGTGAN
jgi:hypothetical protein